MFLFVLEQFGWRPTSHVSWRKSKRAKQFELAETTWLKQSTRVCLRARRFSAKEIHCAIYHVNSRLRIVFN